MTDSKQNQDNGNREEGSGKNVMIRYFFIYLAIVNVFAFILFWVDKRRAVYNGEIEKAKRRRKPEPVRPMKRRISEKTLLVTAAIGGSIGSMAGMWIFRHKTKHWYFKYGLPVILLLQLLVFWVAVKGI